MVLTGLLIIAAVSVVLGLVLASATWLIVSLVASVLAAFFLYRSWGTIKERRTNMARRKKPAESGPSGASPPSVGVTASSRPDDVWVVDGRPAYHRSGCAELAGRTSEPIPLGQALEDGFTPCATCAPATGAGAEPSSSSAEPSSSSA